MGRHEISFDAGARQTDKCGGWFHIGFQSRDRKGLGDVKDFRRTPMNLHFSEKGLIEVSGAEMRIPYAADEIHHFQFLVDMDKHTWSLKVDGAGKSAGDAVPRFHGQ